MHPVHLCVLLSVSVITVKRSAGGAAPEPGKGQRAWADCVCFSAALGVSRNILFGKKYEKEQYEKVIKACALKEVSNGS